MGLTANYNLPFPEGTDGVDINGDVQALGEAVDDALAVVAASGPDLVTVRAKMSTLQSFTDGTLLTVALFDAEDWDTHAMHDNVTNKGRITIPAAQDGRYLLEAFVELPNPAAASNLVVYIRKNGAGIISGDANAGANYGPANHVLNQALAIDQAVAGDYFEAIVAQQSGATRTVISAHFTAIRIQD